MKTTKKILIAAFLISLSLTRVQAGWVIRLSNSDGTGEMVLKFQDGTMAMDMGGMVSIILNTNNDMITWISHTSKKYWSGTGNEFKKQQKEMIRAMTGMDPEQPAREPEQEIPVEIEKVGSEEILGYTADHYRIASSGELKEEVWIAPDVTVYKEIDWERMQKLLDSMSGEDTKDYTQNSAYESLMQKGYPLRSTDYTDGEVSMQGEATAVDKKDIPRSELSVPSGYDRVDTVSEFYKYMYGQQ